MKIPQLGLKPQKGDVGDRAARWQAISWCAFAGLFIAVAAILKGAPALPTLAAACLFSYVAGSLIAWFSGQASHTFMHTLLAGRGEPRAPEYSSQEALLIQGRIEECIKSFHSYIAHHPEDLDARIRLAEVLGKEGNDPAASEEMYLEARIVGTSTRQDVSVSNGLIDLYRRGGKQEQLKAELARFARNHPGTVEARNAQAYLRRLATDEGHQ